jgi:hydrogenase expression/formation protein HypC
MCLALPAQVVSISDDEETARVSLEGVKKEISLALVQEVGVGDYVLVHVGYALNKISPQEAEKTLALMAEAGVVDGERGGADNEVR